MESSTARTFWFILALGLACVLCDVFVWRNKPVETGYKCSWVTKSEYLCEKETPDDSRNH